MVEQIFNLHFGCRITHYTNCFVYHLQNSWKNRLVEPSPNDLRSADFTNALHSGHVRSLSNLCKKRSQHFSNCTLTGRGCWKKKKFVVVLHLSSIVNNWSQSHWVSEMKANMPMCMQSMWLSNYKKERCSTKHTFLPRGWFWGFPPSREFPFPMGWGEIDLSFLFRGKWHFSSKRKRRCLTCFNSFLVEKQSHWNLLPNMPFM